MVELLLERGAIPDDHDLYLAGFAHDRHELLPLLLARVAHLADIAEQALAAPISSDDVEATRLLLDAGAVPGRYRDDDGQPVSIVWAAIQAGCRPALLELLLAHGADPNLAGPDGRSPYRVATAAARSDACELLRRFGADTDVPAVDRFVAACLRADRAEAQQQLDADPDLRARLGDDERAALVRASERGNREAVELMLELGFPIESRGDDGATALHAAAYAGSATSVRLLLERGADIEARDATWNSTPLDWAMVGSGERPRTDPAADWAETVRTLIEHGAVLDHITLSPDDPKPPSPEVAAILVAQRDERSSR